VHCLVIFASCGTSRASWVDQVLVTLGGCRHLDGPEQRWIVGWLSVIVAGSDQVIVRGS
jgi:hypothetical protein